MLSNFDKHIRSILQDFKSEEAPASAWDAMNTLLDKELPVTDNNFDSEIKDKMAHYSPNDKIIPFSILAEKLDSADLPNADVLFDDQVKSQLSNLQAPKVANAWALMEDKLNQQIEADFNQEVKEKLENMSVPYQSSTWPVLADKIDKAEKRRRKVIITKFAELSVLLLLLVTAINFGLRPNSIPKAPAVQEYLHKIQKQAQKFQLRKQKQTSNNVAAISKDSDVDNTRIIDVSIDNSTVDIDFNQSIQNDIPVNTVFNPIIREEHEVISSQVEKRTRLKANAPIRSFDQSDEVIDIAFTQEDQVAVSDVRLVKSNNFNPLGIIQAGVDLANQQINFNLPSLKAPSFKAIELEVSGKGDINFIETPFDEVYRTDPYNQTAAGYGGQIKARIDFKTFLIETGIGYSKKTYQPREIIEYFDGDLRYGFRGISLSQIEMDVISIPLNIVHYISKDGPWRFYSKLGASLHMIGVSDYHLQEYALGHGNQPASIPSENEADILEKNFESGIIEGGSFFQNSYFTLNMGFGIENRLTDRYSIFAEPQYQHGIFNPELGPNKDNIHNLSLSLGARVTL